ncbi:MAG: SAM-dependent methyltransferase [Acidimicrobiales bacterium]
MSEGFSPEGAGETAIGAAMMRARESGRVGGLIHDPYAAAFVAAAPPVFEEGPSTDHDPALAALEAAFEEAVVIRTRFYDDFVRAASADGCRQVVVLGAGLDARAFRLDWPAGTRLFELDLPDVLGFKQRVLSSEGAEPRCTRITIEVDLQTDWSAPVIAAGLEPLACTAWVAEGLIPYLSGHDAERLLITIGELSSRGSRLALDHASTDDESLLRQARATPTMDRITAMWKGGLGATAAGWLRQHGWQVEVVDHESLAAKYGRGGTSSALGGFATAIRL